MLHVTQSRLNGAAAALNETRRRTKEMMELNDQVEKTMQNIPSTIHKIDTTTNTERSAWIPWRKTTTTHTSSKMVRLSLMKID